MPFEIGCEDHYAGQVRGDLGHLIIGLNPEATTRSRQRSRNRARDIRHRLQQLHRPRFKERGPPRAFLRPRQHRHLRAAGLRIEQSRHLHDQHRLQVHGIQMTPAALLPAVQMQAPAFFAPSLVLWPAFQRHLHPRRQFKTMRHVPEGQATAQMGRFEQVM